MEKLTVIDCQEEDVVTITVGEKSFVELKGSELLDALYLWHNTQQELKEDAVLLQEPKQSPVALFYTEMEATNLKKIPYVIYKNRFNPEEYPEDYNEAYSAALGQTLQGKVILIGITKIPVFSLIFSDGSRYDHGNRKSFSKVLYSEEEIILLSNAIDKRNNG